MNITTSISRQPVRTSSVAFTMAAAVLLCASACGTEKAVDRTPATLGQAPAPSARAVASPDVEECLREQAKVPGDTLRCWELTQPNGDEQDGPLLAPKGRPVPLPGGNG